MPAAGEQYRGITNPFDEEKPRISEWTAREIATLQSRLDKQLGPEFVSSRKGPGGRQLYYLPAEKAINLANDVFGFNGWSSSIRNVQIDFCDESKSTGKITLGLSIIIRVTLKDGTFHEDIGYGHIENCTGKAAAFEKAKKEAATDALKRALRTFGNVLGNCLYDKAYESRISKMKVAPSKWDPDALHRHRDFAPVKTEKPEMSSGSDHQKVARITSSHSVQSNGTELEDEFGGNLFEGVDFEHADENDDSAYESMLAEKQAMEAPDIPPQQRAALSRVQSMPAMKQANGAPGPHPAQPASKPPTSNARVPFAPNANAHIKPDPQRRPTMPPPHDTKPPPPPQNQPAHQNKPPTNSNPSSLPSDTTPANPPAPTPGRETPVGFITGRAADLLQKAEAGKDGAVPNVPAFNPHAESPSLRRTSGINHKTSAPVMRGAVQPHSNGTAGGGAGTAAAGGLGAAGAAGGPGGAASGFSRPNFVNPHADAGRRIGMPGGAAMSPLANRSTYKMPGPAAGVKRAAGAGEGGGGGAAAVAGGGGGGGGVKGADGQGEESKKARVS